MNPQGPTDTFNAEVLLGQRALVVIIATTCGLGLMWAVILLAFGSHYVAAVVLGYVVLSFFNLAYLQSTGRFRTARTVQLFLILLGPFATQAALGGFASGGAVILAAFIAPVGALLFHSIRTARLLLALFAVLIVVAGVLEASGRLPTPSGPPTVLLFVINLPFLVTPIYLVLEYFLNQQQRLHTLLQARHDALQAALADLKAAQAQLVQQEKLASLGQLAAGVAHEIKNPLNFINNFAAVNEELFQELRDALAAGEPADDLLADLEANARIISRHGTRANAIVESMMQHAGRSSNQHVPTDLNALVEECVGLAYHGMPSPGADFRPTIVRDYADDPPKVDVIPHDLRRVFLNLIGNALYAVREQAQTAPDGYVPTVSIRTRAYDNDIEVRVTDNGPGVPPELQDRIFEPFFTTKPTGEGTGLGLSLSFDIVAQGHGGRLQVEPADDGGASFVVTLPVRARPVAAPAPVH